MQRLSRTHGKPLSLTPLPCVKVRHTVFHPVGQNGLVSSQTRQTSLMWEPAGVHNRWLGPGQMRDPALLAPASGNVNLYQFTTLV